jgi:riboflavin synthase
MVMFTGLVSEIGTLESAERSGEGARLRIRADLAKELEPGDSVSVSGACLTVTGGDGDAFEADVMNQTLEVTTLGGLGDGSHVNLERALRAGDALDGHLVQGHVDCRGTVASVAEDGFARRLKVELPEDARRYVAQRGSVALDGVSLTVSALADTGFEVSLIPETLDRTTLGDAAEGDTVNVELDVVARYVERLMPTLGSKDLSQ